MSIFRPLNSRFLFSKAPSFLFTYSLTYFYIHRYLPFLTYSIYLLYLLSLTPFSGVTPQGRGRVNRAIVMDSDTCKRHSYRRIHCDRMRCFFRNSSIFCQHCFMFFLRWKIFISFASSSESKAHK